MSKEDGSSSCLERLKRQKCREQRIREDRGETTSREESCVPDVGVCKQDARQYCQTEVKKSVKKFPQTLTFMEHSCEFKQVLRNFRIGVGVAMTALLVGGQVYQELVVKPRTREVLRRYQRDDPNASPLGVEEMSARLRPDANVAFRSSMNLDVVEDASQDVGAMEN